MAKKSSTPPVEGKKEVKKKKVNTKKALGIIQEITNLIDSAMNKDVTAPVPIKSTELKPFRK